MRHTAHRNRCAALAVWTVLAGMAACMPAARSQDKALSDHSASSRPAVEQRPKLDRSGRKQAGQASFYAEKFEGRIMADGTPMDPLGDNAASKTLPLGTTAKVTNLGTGQTAVVTIEDRGPFVKGRIIDLSPMTARKIGIARSDGVAKVEVAPIAVPLADGSVLRGNGSQVAGPIAARGEIR
jgi:rare lipoprotein A